ncbi:hypothetical protein VNO78_11036 [Psophocarpus tetragonolobus]|uniref:Uncharacterized protein n=1 Tax=Psophocarpus tetragonolobus TaxID=3891 RepID=A0AAN9SLQ2_PSOTE
MAKSLRSKKEKRLRAIRREIVEPLYDKKEAAKLAVQEAALAAPKLQVPVRSNIAMDASTSANDTTMDLEMADGSESMPSLKPVGGIGKKSKKKMKLAKNKRRGKGKLRRNQLCGFSVWLYALLPFLGRQCIDTLVVVFAIVGCSGAD